MPFCPVPRLSLLRTPGHLPSGLARQKHLQMDALRGNRLSTFFPNLKFLFPWGREVRGKGEGEREKPNLYIISTLEKKKIPYACY